MKRVLETNGNESIVDDMEAVVEYPYNAQETDELTLKKGDVIKNIKTQPGGWWEGTLGNQRGMFPDNFVRLINDPSKPRSDGVTLRQGGSRRKCRVLFSYRPANDDELQLFPDDVIDILEEVEEGWWKGKLKDRIGVFPSNFVSEIPPTESNRTSSPGHQRDLLSTSREDAASSSSTSSLTGVTNSLNETNTPSIDDAPSLPPKPVKETCLALFPYEAVNEDELTLKEGDIIVLLSREVADKGWWRGELRGRVGVFPDNFVELIPAEDSSKKPERPASKPHLLTTNRARDSLTKTAAAAAAASTTSTATTTTTTTSSTALTTPNSLSSTPATSPSTTTTAAAAGTATTTSTSLESKTSGPPLVCKKPILPPPPTTKKPNRVSPSNSSSGPKRESTETADGPGPTKSARGASDITDGASLSLSKGRPSDSITKRSLLGEFDMIVRHGMLTQPTRERGPRRRPPKGGATFSSNSSSNQLPSSSPFDYIDGLTNGTNEDASMEEDITDESEQQSLVKPNWKSTSSTQPQQTQQVPWVEELKMNQARKSQSPKGATTITTPSPSSTSSSISGRGTRQSGTSPAASTSSETPTTIITRPRSLYEPTNTSNKSRPLLGHSTANSSSTNQSSSNPNNNLLNHSTRNSIDLHSLTTQMQALSTSNTLPQEPTISCRQYQELNEKVNQLEQLIEIQREAFQKIINEQSQKLQEETEHRIALQREVDKLSQLVTQV